MLELINKSRKAAGLAPLAMNNNINTAADLHTDYQMDVNKLTHTGSGGTSAYTRMVNAGYDFNGSSTWGENVGWVGLMGSNGYQDDIEAIHTRLMNSSGHRANILNSGFREIGIGIDTGSFQGYNSILATEDFAKANGNAFVTGVAFDDKDGDRFYDLGEAFGAVTVTAVNSSTGAKVSTTSGSAGGYALKLAAGTYNLTFSASGYATKTSTVTIGSSNVKVDWIDPATSSTVTDPTPPPSTGTITGTSSSETLTGTTSSDVMKGLAGNDTFKGNGGADTMYGGTGNDIFYLDSSGDVVIENTKEGTDKVVSTVDHKLADFIENLTLSGTSSIDGTGNTWHNTIYGNAAANTLSGLTGDDKLYGQAGNDLLLGGDGADRLYGGSGNDRLEGGAGNDFFQGGTGTDTLIGGSGADTFDWNYTADIGKGTTRDVILDFTRGSDKIDLSGIDARADTSGNNSFSFIGSQAFSGVDGQLRFFDGGTYEVVQGDVNGDKIADFELRLEGIDTLSATDFIL
jgi:Ca2+-binding RTX toxin-like protein